MASNRRVRRSAGFVVRYVSDELLRRVMDPRSTRGRVWRSCIPLLRAVLLGLLCGCKGLGEVEELTKEMSKSLRRALGIPGRIPDTTLRDFLCKLEPESVSELLHVVGYDAWRRKALPQVAALPWGWLSMDGKYPVIRSTEQWRYLQVHHDEDGEAVYGTLRTITATLVSAQGRPILGAVPVLGDTNEMGGFQKAMGDMVRIYGRLFRVVMYDAGAASLDNANAVLAAGKHYFFHIADSRWIMHQTLELLLRDVAPAAIDEEVVSSSKRIVRALSLVPLKPTPNNLTVWQHARTALKMRTETYDGGELKSTETRYFVTSLDSAELPAETWLRVIVMRWGVETSHQILDGDAFAEDRRPWITSDAKGALAVMLLRRVAYTLLTLYRSVTQRSDDNRCRPFRKLMEWLKDAVKWATSDDLEGLRPRSFAVPAALA